jgi:hypothetical protein
LSWIHRCFDIFINECHDKTHYCGKLNIWQLKRRKKEEGKREREGERERKGKKIGMKEGREGGRKEGRLGNITA